MRVTSFIISPSDPLVNFLLPFPETSGSASLDVLVPKGEMLPPEDTTIIPLGWSLLSSNASTEGYCTCWND